jgi:hypothetical protein
MLLLHQRINCKETALNSRREKRTLQAWFILILVAAGVCMTAAILVQSIWAMLLVWSLVALDLYWFYTRYHKKVKPKYPMAPPDAKAVDAYFPRTNIPRPIYEDVRRMHEEKQKLEKVRKLRMQRRRKKH